MRISLSTTLFFLAGTTASAFVSPARSSLVCRNSNDAFFMSTETAATMADSGKPPAHSEEDAHVSDVEIPTVLPSDVGMDYVPLATMLATGQLAEADQVRSATTHQTERGFMLPVFLYLWLLSTCDFNV